MLRLVHFERRFVAAIGIIALAAAYLPGVVSILNARVSVSCCTGVLCPMHQSAEHMTCGMGTTHSGVTCEACACHQNQYAGGLIFNRVTHPPLTNQRIARAPQVLIEITFPSAEPEVLSPPPRFELS